MFVQRWKVRGLILHMMGRMSNLIREIIRLDDEAQEQSAAYSQSAVRGRAEPVQPQMEVRIDESLCA